MSSVENTVRSVFDDGRMDGLFTTYAAELTFRSKLMAGTPKDPKLMSAWLRSKAGVTDEDEVRRMMIRTLIELGADVPEEATLEDLERASDHMAVNNGCGFKRDANGIYIESRQVKALFKEATNILYAGDRWGRTKKGPRSFLAERVFVEPEHISLGCDEPDGIELFVGHVTDKLGPRATLTQYEYVVQPTLRFEVKVLQDAIEPEHWASIWTLGELNGLGALRSQGFGQFVVTRWEVVS